MRSYPWKKNQQLGKNLSHKVRSLNSTVSDTALDVLYALLLKETLQSTCLYPILIVLIISLMLK